MNSSDRRGFYTRVAAAAAAGGSPHALASITTCVDDPFAAAQLLSRARLGREWVQCLCIHICTALLLCTAGGSGESALNTRRAYIYFDKLAGGESRARRYSKRLECSTYAARNVESAARYIERMGYLWVRVYSARTRTVQRDRCVTRCTVRGARAPALYGGVGKS